MSVPDHLCYTADHEWALVEGGRVRVGITHFAQEALGDVVFVQLPAVGAAVEAGGSFCEVESTKSVSDVYAPVSGEVVEVNTGLVDAPQRVNEDPYGDGWIAVIATGAGGPPAELLDAEGYRRLLAGPAADGG